MAASAAVPACGPMPISLRSVCPIGRCRCRRVVFAPTSKRPAAAASPFIRRPGRRSSLMAPQDQGYRAFITELHRRMKAAGSKAALIGGIGPTTYAAAVAMVALLAIAMTGLLVRALATSNSPAHCFWSAWPSVRLADRRLHQTQPAAQLHFRSASRGAAAIGAFAIKRNRNVTSRNPRPAASSRPIVR